MCLLIVAAGVDPDAPLVVAANRDERLDRPARPLAVLRPAEPRILGGQDLVAGGTWLAVNEHGVVAGLTNRPSPEGRDPAKRSRGELPVALAQHRDARRAVKDFASRYRPADYNPAWLLVGDRTSLFALDMTTPGEDAPGVEELGPGVHILENNPIHVASPKVDHVRALLGAVGGLEGTDLVERVRAVLVDHSVPTAVSAPVADSEGERSGLCRPVASQAACVHTENYGTRSSTIVAVPASTERRPRLLVAGGHPCTSPFFDVTDLFES